MKHLTYVIELYMFGEWVAGAYMTTMLHRYSGAKPFSTLGKGVFKGRGGGVQGVQTPPEIFRFFLKSEGKEIERKRKKGMLRGGGGGGVTS